jgi:uncharacterized protein YkwD
MFPRSLGARLGRFAILAGAAFGWAGCEKQPEQSSTSVGSNSNWFRSCVGDDECGDLGCICGACGRACSSDPECADLNGGRCAPADSAAALVQCTAPADAKGLCLPRCEAGDCGPRQACVAGACVLLEMPDNAFCGPVQAPDRAARTFEDELLALVGTLRAEGGTACGGTVAAPAPALRLDARLACVARVRAADIATTGSAEFLDSEGRTPEQRLAAAGYPNVVWAESFSFDGTSAAHALELMRQDTASCRRLSDAALQSIGIGAARDVAVIVMGAD